VPRESFRLTPGEVASDGEKPCIHAAAREHAGVSRMVSTTRVQQTTKRIRARRVSSRRARTARTKSSPSRWRFRPPHQLTFRLGISRRINRPRTAAPARLRPSRAPCSAQDRAYLAGPVTGKERRQRIVRILRRSAQPSSQRPTDTDPAPQPASPRRSAPSRSTRSASAPAAPVAPLGFREETEEREHGLALEDDHSRPAGRSAAAQNRGKHDRHCPAFSAAGLSFRPASADVCARGRVPLS
jgi:hypothetical protein